MAKDVLPSNIQLSQKRLNHLLKKRSVVKQILKNLRYGSKSARLEMSPAQSPLFSSRAF
jgi:hypothetical protein